MHVLEDLWGGKANLHERGFPSKQYAGAMQRLANCGENLLAVLTEEQRKLFEEYVDDQLEVSIIADCASFQFPKIRIPPMWWMLLPTGAVLLAAWYSWEKLWGGLQMLFP